MTVPARFSGATAAQQADRLRAILEGRDWKPEGAIRVRHQAGYFGWLKDGIIYPDGDHSGSMYAYWMTNSEWDQEDFGVPPAGWYAFDGWWEEVAS